MNYQNNEQGLVQLLQKLEYVEGTFPPVYKLGSFLIGYDKSERIKVLTDTEPEEAKPVQYPHRQLKAVANLMTG